MQSPSCQVSVITLKQSPPTDTLACPQHRASCAAPEQQLPARAARSCRDSCCNRVASPAASTLHVSTSALRPSSGLHRTLCAKYGSPLGRQTRVRGWDVLPSPVFSLDHWLPTIKVHPLWSKPPSAHPHRTSRGPQAQLPPASVCVPTGTISAGP